MSKPGLYGAEWAWLWPGLSPMGDYVAEAGAVDGLLAERLGEGPKRVLELGVGAGHHLVHLLAAGASASRAAGGWGGEHEGVGVDASAAMLREAASWLPGGALRRGDMRDVRLGERFDAVLIPDAVDYLSTPADVERALATVVSHLRPGGLALVVPTYTVETFEEGASAEDRLALPAEGEPGFEAFSARGVTGVSYGSRVERVGAEAFELVLTIRLERGAAGGELLEDRHRCGLFAEGRWLGWMASAGLVEVGWVDGPTGRWLVGLGLA